MSDAAIVAAVALVSAACVAIVWLRFRAEALRRMEEREERERGVFPRMEAVEKALADMKNTQATFMANARSRQ